MTGKRGFKMRKKRLNLFVIMCFLSVSLSIMAASSKDALILFYTSSCPHCQRFAPIVKAYSDQHRLPVLAYTLDGENLSVFPETVVPNAFEMQRFFPDGHPVVPVLFWMNASIGRIFPVLRGEATFTQLQIRMQKLKEIAQRLVEEENNDSK